MSRTTPRFILAGALCGDIKNCSDTVLCVCDYFFFFVCVEYRHDGICLVYIFIYRCVCVSVCITTDGFCDTNVVFVGLYGTPKRRE